MKIPIFNTFFIIQIKINSKKIIDLKILNNLNFQKIDLKRFPIVKNIKINYLKKTLYLKQF